MGFEHEVSAARSLSAEDAERVSRVMSALATASRVRILAHLRQGPCSVGDLTEAVAMEQSAVSHQLRVLRDLGLVVSAREGRHTIYGLYDSHVQQLIDEALRHVSHHRAGEALAPVRTTDPARTTPSSTDSSTDREEAS